MVTLTNKVVGYVTIDVVWYCWITESGLSKHKPYGQMYFFVTHEDNNYHLFFMGHKLVATSKTFDSDYFTKAGKKFLEMRNLVDTAKSLASKKSQLR